MMSAPAIDEIIADFEELGDDEERLEYLIELGSALPELGEEHRTEANRVQGCQSNVWMIVRPQPGEPPTLEFAADSDAVIVRGLVGVLLSAYAGRTPQEIIDYPVEGVFQRLGLKRFLSPMRSNGLFSMVKRVRALAAEYV